MRNRILFADSSSTIQKVAEMAFENENISVSMTGSGEETLSMLEEITPDLIVADEDLPDIPGIELCKKIKESGLYSLIPFLMLQKEEILHTDDSDENPVPDDFLLKPFKSEELVSKVKELINISQNYSDEILDISAGQQDDASPADDFDSEEPLKDQSDSQEALNELVRDTTEDDILAGLDEEEEMSLYDVEEVIPLTGQEELSAGEDGSGELLPPEIEISSTEEELPEEEMDLSGLLSEEDLQAGAREIEKRNRELDEIFRFGDGEEEARQSDNDTSGSANPEEFFREKRTLPEPATAPATWEPDEMLKASLKKGLEDINEKIIREELKEYLHTLTPDLMKTIEKAIWDVMPDLAESLLKKEIEKIKNG